MKFSEMTTEQGMVCAAKVLPLMCKIAENKKVKSMFEAAAKEGKTYSDLVFELLPVFFSDVKKEFFQILSVMGEKTTAEVEKQPFVETLSEMKGVMDGTFFGFFSYALNMKKEK